MKIHLVVFDLDGTIVRSHENIYKAMIASLLKLNIFVNVDKEKFYQMIGAHFEDIFKEMNIPVTDFNVFIKYYKEFYFHFIDSSILYPNVKETIKLLNENGIKVALLTTKAQDQAELNLKHFKMIEMFNYVMGRRPGLGHKPSPEPLLKICEDLGVSPIETIIVGDSELDILCGKSAGSRTCAVTYGYRTREELEKHTPDFIIDDFAEIIDVINS